MPKPMRIEFVGAIYHLMSQGDCREPIFHGDQDRKVLLQTMENGSEMNTGKQRHRLADQIRLEVQLPSPLVHAKKSS